MKKSRMAGGLILVVVLLAGLWLSVRNRPAPARSPAPVVASPPGQVAAPAPEPTPAPAPPTEGGGSRSTIKEAESKPPGTLRTTSEPSPRGEFQPAREPEPQPAAATPSLRTESAGVSTAGTLPAAEPPRIPETNLTPSLTAPVAPSPPPIPGSQRELDAIQQVIAQYEQMYDQLDARAVASIWPSVDARELGRIFSRLQRQNLSFDSCVFALAESKATAQCDGWLRYVPRVGNATTHSEHHLWTIQLERAAGAWSIVQVAAR